ncbi:MAG: hypothetical protein ABWY27_21145, partial [Telluria sp.]
MNVPKKSNALTLRAIGLAIGAALALSAGSAAAVNLQQAYDAALKNDPTFKMGFYESEAGKESRIIGRAALLPNVSASYSSTRNRVAQTQIVGKHELLSHPRYISRGAA